jgi:hypothetical protein
LSHFGNQVEMFGRLKKVQNKFLDPKGLIRRNPRR